MKKRHAIELSLARVEQQLAGSPHPERRKALEAARQDLLHSLDEL